MKRLLFSAALMASASLSFAQIGFDPSIEFELVPDKVIMPENPLTYQILFIGGVDMVQTTATYGNGPTEVPAKQWHDFIGFTPDTVTGSPDLGWLSVNHEMIVQDDNIGDGGGMTVFKIRRDANTDSIVVVSQTLADGRTGEFFNVDFANTVGETGMNCGGITSAYDGRIWTAEEWWRSDNSSIADRDTTDFTIGTGSAAGQAAPAGFPGYNGQTISKYQNFNWMVEIDPREAVAVRKQYNWGRQSFEGGCVMPDNQTVYLGSDATPGFLTKFVADNPGDFTQGTTYVYKHDANPKWIEIDNSDLNNMLNYADMAVAAGATMFNRLEWVSYNSGDGNVYFTETGRDNPASRWADEHAAGAVHAPHTLARAAAQNTHPDSSDYWDYYGRVLQLDVTTDEVSVFLEAGPAFTNGVSYREYPSKHLSNPDGLGFLHADGRDWMLICEDLNGDDFGRMPEGVCNRTCELYMLDMSLNAPSIDNLIRISMTPLGAEITGVCASPDGKTIFVNSQHPSSTNPYPYNNSLTYAITGWASVPNNIAPPTEDTAEFDLYPNPTSREVYFNKVSDIAIYDATGQLIRVERQVRQINVEQLAPGTYYIQNAEGAAKALIIQ